MGSETGALKICHEANEILTLIQVSGIVSPAFDVESDPSFWLLEWSLVSWLPTDMQTKYVVPGIRLDNQISLEYQKLA